MATSANITCYIRPNSLGREQVCAISVQTVLCGNIIGNHGELNQFILTGSFITSHAFSSQILIVYKLHGGKFTLIVLVNLTLIPIIPHASPIRHSGT